MTLTKDDIIGENEAVAMHARRLIGNVSLIDVDSNESLIFSLMIPSEVNADIITVRPLGNG